MSEVEDTRAGLRRNLEALLDLLQVLEERRVFKRPENRLARDEVVRRLVSAERRLEQEGADLPAVREELMQARFQLQEQQRLRGRLWDFFFMRNVLLVAFQVSMLVLVVWWSASPCGPSEILKVPKIYVALGAAAAIIKTLHWIHQKTSRLDYRPRFLTTYLVAPFMGATSGMVSYLAVSSGLLSLNATPPKEQGSLALFAVTIAVGWNWMPVFDWMATLAARVLASQGAPAPAKPAAASDARPAAAADDPAFAHRDVLDRAVAYARELGAVEAVSWGPKYVGGQPTAAVALRFHVTEKRGALDPKRRVAPTFLGLPTDVVVSASLPEVDAPRLDADQPRPVGPGAEIGLAQDRAARGTLGAWLTKADRVFALTARHVVYPGATRALSSPAGSTAAPNVVGELADSDEALDVAWATVSKPLADLSDQVGGLGQAFEGVLDLDGLRSASVELSGAESGTNIVSGTASWMVLVDSGERKLLVETGAQRIGPGDAGAVWFVRDQAKAAAMHTRTITFGGGFASVATPMAAILERTGMRLWRRQ
ncbi:MAG: hypothetical protein KC933_35875 [Myxococcales bacterium]|nr:hypothetical protein [Myxococcales bacterium]MCB9645968.1 hypothetical protein [Deltaproteobacteria bacterium]